MFQNNDECINSGRTILDQQFSLSGLLHFLAQCNPMQKTKIIALKDIVMWELLPFGIFYVGSEIVVIVTDMTQTLYSEVP